MVANLLLVAIFVYKKAVLSLDFICNFDNFRVIILDNFLIFSLKKFSLFTIPSNLASDQTTQQTAL